MIKKIFLSSFVLLLLLFSACSISDTLFGTKDTPVIDSDLLLGRPYVFSNMTNQTSSNEMPEFVNVSDSESIVDDQTSFIPSISVVEGDIISLQKFEAVDPDGDSIMYTYQPPFDADGFWETVDGDEGTYVTTIIANDGFLSTSQEVNIIILPSNKGPVINCPSLLTINEGEFVDVPCTIYDMEGDDITYTVSGFKDSLSFDVSYDSAGEQTLLITATDGQKTTTKEITILIANTNRPPQVVSISPITVVEGETIRLDVEAVDPDGDELQITYPSRFTTEGIWQTSRGDVGTYDLEAQVSDGTDVTRLPVRIVVEKLNVPPVIQPIDTIVVDEGELIVLPINVTDEDGDDVVITISGFMTSKEYQTTYDDQGEHIVTITATDGVHTENMDVLIQVNDVNRPPVFVFE